MWPLPTGGPLSLLLGDAEGDCERGTATPSATTAAVRLLPRPGVARSTCVGWTALGVLFVGGGMGVAGGCDAAAAVVDSNGKTAGDG